MKKGLPYAVLASSAFALAVAPTPTFAQEVQAVQLPAGIYFESDTEEGEYYSLQDWIDLGLDERGQLIAKYGQGNVKILLEDGQSGMFATLNEIVEQNKTFLDVSRPFEPGDIVGSFRTPDGQIITAPEAPAEEGELKVESVRAITTIIKNEKEQQLKIEVTDDKGATKEVTVEELTEAGYTVEFLYNKFLTDLTEEVKKAATESGIVNADSGVFANGFKYAVKVTPAEGEAITSEWVDVKVLSATTATEVTGVKLVKTADNKDYELSYLTVNPKGTGVKFAASGAKNAFGEELKAENFPEVQSVKALTPTKAYYSNGQIIATEEGTAKFEVKFKGIEEAQIVEVEVKAATKADSVKESTVKIKKAPGVAAKLTILDQYGVEFPLSSAEGFKATIIDSKNNETDDDVTLTVDNDGKLVVPFDGKEAGTYTVKIQKDDKDFATVTVTVVDASEAIAQSYKVVEVDGTKLNLTFGEEQYTKNYKLVGVYDGVDIDIGASIAKLIDENGGGKLVITVADEDVATATISGDTITVNAVGKGETTATVEFVAGSYKVTLVDSFPITVINDTPQYTRENVSLPNDKKAIQVTGALTAEDIEAGLVYDGEALTAGSVDKESIVLVNIDFVDGKLIGDVVFKTHQAFGGKSFAFPVEITLDAGAIAPTDGVTSVNSEYVGVGENLQGVNAENALFLVAGLVDEKGNETPVPLSEVKKYLDSKYDVNFNMDAITIGDGEVSIDGTILSPADWYKIKKDADLTRPYRITLLKNNANPNKDGKYPNDQRALRIAMYADGKAVIENGSGQTITHTQ